MRRIEYASFGTCLFLCLIRILLSKRTSWRSESYLLNIQKLSKSSQAFKFRITARQCLQLVQSSYLWHKARHKGKQVGFGGLST